MRPPEGLLKVGGTMGAAGRYHSHFYSAGAPGAAAAPSPGINGAALTSFAGQIPFTNPVSGNSHLARWAMNASQPCSLLLCDRLWHNSGLNLTIATSQAITSGAMPARDRDGSTNGAGLLCGLEFSAAGGAGTPTVTLGYTNSANTAGRTSTFSGPTTPAAGSFFPWPLQAGDVGIRSIQSFQLSVTWTSGTAHMVVYRILAVLCVDSANTGNAIDFLTGGGVRLYDNTTPFILQLPASTTATNLAGQMIVTQG